MPTKKKRVGFIPRQDVMRIIEKLSIENNLSNSKIISILVEEALSIRGIFNKKNGKLTQLYQSTYDNSKNLFDNSSDRSFSGSNSSLPMPQPSAVTRLPISAELSILSKRAFSTFSIFPFKGRMA